MFSLFYLTEIRVLNRSLNGSSQPFNRWKQILFLLSSKPAMLMFAKCLVWKISASIWWLVVPERRLSAKKEDHILSLSLLGICSKVSPKDWNRLILTPGIMKDPLEVCSEKRANKVALTQIKEDLLWPFALKNISTGFLRSLCSLRRQNENSRLKGPMGGVWD